MDLHVERNSQLHPVFLDKNSGLTKQQIDTINTILFGQYRRFRRAVAVYEEDEPRVLKNFINQSSALTNVFDRSYGIAHTISFTLNVGLADKGKILCGELNNSPSVLFQSGGTGSNNTESLPGYFSMDGRELIFNISGGHTNRWFNCYLFWLS